MGIWAWLILLAFSAAFATAVQYLVFHTTHPRSDDFDWVFLAGGALIGGFTAHVWYPSVGPIVDGLHLLPALAGAVVLGMLAELVYRSFIRPRQTA
jgi:cytochrome c biogenesis protein CcdA